MLPEVALDIVNNEQHHYLVLKITRVLFRLQCDSSLYRRILRRLWKDYGNNLTKDGLFTKARQKH